MLEGQLPVAVVGACRAHGCRNREGLQRAKQRDESGERLTPLIQFCKKRQTPETRSAKSLSQVMDECSIRHTQISKLTSFAAMF